jgi:hypothetical protein
VALALAVAAPAQPPIASSGPGPLPPIQPVRFQEGARGDIEQELAPPGLERLSRLEPDEKLFERIRQEALAKNPTEQRPVFPESPILSRDRYAGRGDLWQKRQLTVEPSFTCYGKLQSVFEDRNGERYGWDFGPMSVPLSLAKFYADFALMPLKAFANPCRWHECGAGQCLPGDPVPYMLYPIEVNCEGVTAEAAVIIALIAVFP